MFGLQIKESLSLEFQVTMGYMEVLYIRDCSRWKSRKRLSRELNSTDSNSMLLSDVGLGGDGIPPSVRLASRENRVHPHIIIQDEKGSMP